MLDNKIIDFIVNGFGSKLLLLEIQKVKNINEIVNDEYVQIYIDDMAKQVGINLTDKDQDLILKRIKSIHFIRQDEGAGLKGDYEHDLEWYDKMLNNSSYEEFFWERYKNYLINEKHYSKGIMDILEYKTLHSLMSYIGDPNSIENYSIRGLLIGDVQSGKTSNYLGLMCKAADVGYKVIILLSGRIESLRMQTQVRVEEGFIGYDVANARSVGVGSGEKMPKAVTTRECDYIKNADQNTLSKIDYSSTVPLIFVVKKNASVLKKLYTSLKNINTDQYHPTINSSLLLIDDEADDSSINTNNDELNPTKINDSIRNILSLFEKNTYLAVTATPFANVFIGYDPDNENIKDDLFPKDFIYALKPPSNYCGAKKYFYDDRKFINYIKDNDPKIFQLKHKKEWCGKKLFDSFYEAIDCFLLINSIRDVYEINPNTHRTMLINISRYKDVHNVINNIVEDYYKEMKNSIKQNYKLPADKYLKNDSINHLYNSFKKNYGNAEVNGKKIIWKDVFEHLYDSIKNIDIVIVNSVSAKKLNYDKYKETGYRVITIGGLALSRGLTLEGLCVSYFYRSTTTFDTLMQMGRWFGYRDDYENLCRIFATVEACDYYKEISESIEQLKNDVFTMGAQGKKPEEFGIRVRNCSDDLGITSRNKMRNAIVHIEKKSFKGINWETPFIDLSIKQNEENIDTTLKLIIKIEKYSQDIDNKEKKYYTNIPSEIIVDFLKEYKVSGGNGPYFPQDAMIGYIEDNSNVYTKFDLAIQEGESDYLNDQTKIKKVKRSIDIKNGYVRINGERRRLGGPKDTAVGLTKLEIEKIEKDGRHSSKDYLSVKRNPIVNLYFIDPHDVDEKQFIHDVNQSKYKCLVGIAIGFPDYGQEEDKRDIVEWQNKSIQYYDKEHDEVLETEDEE